MYKPNLIIENSRLKVRNLEVIRDEPYTYLSSPASATDTTLTVQNIDDFSVNDWVIIGKIGDEETELKQLHSATAPTGTTVTLSSALTRSHPTDTTIQRVPFNQVEFNRATTSGGSKTVLATTTLQVDREFTVYHDSTNTTGYGYARFKNSTTTTYSQYSDEQAYVDMPYNSISKIIDRVFRKANERQEGFVTRSEIMDYIWDYIDTVEDLKTEWKCEEASQDDSNATTIGGETFTLPTNIKYDDKRSINTISLEGYEPMEYISLSKWRSKIAGISRTTLDGAVSAGATTVDLIDATNFADAGTGYIAGDEFAWTGKTDNQLTGVTGILDHDDESVVYEDEDLGTPEFYTIQNGVGRLYPAPDDESDALTLVIDFVSRLTHPDSENDLLPVTYVSPCIDYCLMCVADKKGSKGYTESKKYEGRFDKKIVQIVKNERLGRQQSMSTRE